MLFLSIVFFIVGGGFLIFGISLYDTGYVTQQTVKFIIFLISFLCLSTGSILFALRKIFILIDEKTQNITRSSNYSQSSIKPENITSNIITSPHVVKIIDTNLKTISIKRECNNYSPWICPFCNTINPILNKSCTKCKAKEVEEKQIHQWACPSCMKLISSYPCSYCGHDINKKNTEQLELTDWICVSCGKSNPALNEKCVSCGETKK